MNGPIRRVFFVLLGLILVHAPQVLAQGGATGAISGTIIDANGGSIADGEVQIINSATNELGRKVNTATDGTFVATLLPPGSYLVAVNKTLGLYRTRVPGEK